MNFVEELRWRGMLQDIMPGTEELLNKEQVTAYLGIDPTADSLHIGHLCGVMILRHLQRCGHKPLALIGGATGMIGDPSGKSAERNLLDEETLRHNQACIKNQLAKQGNTSQRVVLTDVIFHHPSVGCCFQQFAATLHIGRGTVGRRIVKIIFFLKEARLQTQADKGQQEIYRSIFLHHNNV